MKHVIMGVVLVLLGFASGATISGFNGAFEPFCGEDCVNNAWMSMFRWAGACMVAFPAVGLAVWKPFGRTVRSGALIAVALVTVSVFPAWVVYFVRLHFHLRD